MANLPQSSQSDSLDSLTVTRDQFRLGQRDLLEFLAQALGGVSGSYGTQAVDPTAIQLQGSPTLLEAADPISTANNLRLVSSRWVRRYANSAGTSPPSNPIRGQLWVDTSQDPPQPKLWDDTPSPGGWIPVVLFGLPDGTAAAPSLYFKDSGTDTGIYSSGTDAIDIAIAGVRRVGISSTGDVTIYGQGGLRFADSDSSNYVGFRAPSTVGSNVLFTLPGADGALGQRLKTNGSGELSFGGANPGEIIKVQNFYNGGSSTSSGVFVNANTLYFNYTPASNNSTLILIASFQAQISYLANITTYGYFAIGESGTVISSNYAQGANSVAGIGMYALGSIQYPVSNTSTATRSFGIMHRVSNTNSAVSSGSIYFTIFEVAN